MTPNPNPNANKNLRTLIESSHASPEMLPDWVDDPDFTQEDREALIKIDSSVQVIENDLSNNELLKKLANMEIREETLDVLKSIFEKLDANQ
jgi:hypothetical protein